MKTPFLCIAILLVILTSCDRAFTMSGQVISEPDGRPVANARILTSEQVTVYTDSLGRFRVDRFGPGQKSDKPEVLVVKEGYETKYFDLSRVEDIHRLTLQIEPSDRPFVTRYDPSLVKTFYRINLIVGNSIVLITLIFILFKKVRYKWGWLVLILLLNFTVRINYIDGSFDLDAFHLPFYFKHDSFYPFTIKIPILLSTLAFWAFYFFRRDRIRKG